MSSGPPRRADARRNRERLLATAREIFAERGTGAPLDEIARRAGIGNATMYRHFPTRHELIIAVYADEVAELCARGDALLAAGPPGDALMEWLRAFVAHVSEKRDLAQAIPDDQEGARSTLFGRWHEAMHATTSGLLARAQESGAVRAGLDATDLLILASGIALSGAGPERTGRCLGLLWGGLARD